MHVRALLIAALIFPLGAASAAPSHLRDTTAPALTVRAGVRGAARPGRWLPVDVTVTSGDAALTATLAAEWGGAIASRDIALGPASTLRVTLMLRTIAASPAVRVTLTTVDGTVAAQADTPLTLLAVDDPARLCIGEVAETIECAVRIPAAEAPANARALDLADDVVWLDRESARTGEPARAHSLWQAVRWWQDSGAVDPVVKPFDRISRLADRTAIGLAIAVALLLIATAFAAWRRAPAFLLAAVPLAASGAGIALITQSSRDVDMQASSFVHQFSGITQSAVRMKGEVEHPGGQTVQLTPGISDVSLDIMHGLQNSESVATTDGQAIYRNTAGRGVRARFELSGSLDREWLAVATANGNLSIENRAAFALSDCRLQSADAIEIGLIAAGATARIARSEQLAPGDTIVCSIPPDWLDWSSPGAVVRTRGSAFLVFHAWPGPPATESRGSR